MLIELQESPADELVVGFADAEQFSVLASRVAVFARKCVPNLETESFTIGSM